MKNALPYFLFAVAFLSAPQFSAGQETDFAELVPEEGSRPKSFEDYLVQVAWTNNQKKKVIDLKKGAAEEEVKLAKKQWLRSLQFSGALSPRDTTALFNLPAGVPPNTIIPPFMNFGIGWSLGDLFTQRNAVRIKKKEVEIFDYELNEEKLVIRKEVLSAYQKFLTAKKILKARAMAEEDASTNYRLISEKFRNDKATFEDANQASISYHDAVEKRLASESEIELARIQLEELLGVRWEKVEPAKQRYSTRRRN